MCVTGDFPVGTVPRIGFEKGNLVAAPAGVAHNKSPFAHGSVINQRGVFLIGLIGVLDGGNGDALEGSMPWILRDESRFDGVRTFIVGGRHGDPLLGYGIVDDIRSMEGGVVIAVVGIEEENARDIQFSRFEVEAVNALVTTVDVVASDAHGKPDGVSFLQDGSCFVMQGLGVGLSGSSCDGIVES